MNRSIIYCFQYDMEENKVYRQGCVCHEYESSFMISTDEMDPYGEDIFVRKSQLDTVKMTDECGHMIAYIYTRNDDIHFACNLFKRAFKDIVHQKKKALDAAQRLCENFINKYDNMKEKQSLA